MTAAVCSLDVFVPGKPAPQGSKRAVGRGRMVESSKFVGPWRDRVAYLAMQQHPVPIERTVPVELRLDFVMPRPSSAPKRSTPPAIRMPDLDKLIRAVGDALTGIAWADDAQVVDIRATKRLAGLDEGPGCRIRVAAVGADGPGMGPEIHGDGLNPGSAHDLHPRTGRRAMSAPPGPDIMCRRCGRGPLRPRYRGPGPLTNRGRGLCAPCYAWAEQSGQLSSYPRVNRPWAETAAEAERLYAENYPDWTWRDVARHMGIPFWTLDRARREIGRSPQRRNSPSRRQEKPKPAHTPTFDLVDRGEL